jgi:tRNA G18 (ribose-2'-O)-methylase SpoU
MNGKKSPSAPFLILHNVRSALNVGAIFRTADAVGVAKIFLTGYTPTPLDRFGMPDKSIQKTALGAERAVAWEQYKKITQAIRRLKKEGVLIVALEQMPGAMDYKKFKSREPFALLLGNEVRGVSKSLLEKCDAVIEIPMRGKKESLNISVAAGIALFRLLGI